jgi:hypothetical protein
MHSNIIKYSFVPQNTLPYTILIYSNFKNLGVDIIEKMLVNNGFL